MLNINFRSIGFRLTQVAAILGLGVGFFINGAKAEPRNTITYVTNKANTNEHRVEVPSLASESTSGYNNGYLSVCSPTAQELPKVVDANNKISVALYENAFKMGVKVAKDNHCGVTQAVKNEANQNRLLANFFEAEKKAIYGNSRWR